jgi:hypothetical protein
LEVTPLVTASLLSVAPVNSGASPVETKSMEEKKMDNNHTTGPWQAKAEEKTFHKVPRIIGYDILAETECLTRVHHLGANRNEEMAANARLIAAAPEMLEALETALSSLEYAARVLEAPEKSAFRETIEDARSAIAKAKGQSNES